MKKKLLIALCVVMAVSLAVGTTFAYLTDKQTIQNVFTVGNVNIEFAEPDFEQGVNALPGVEIEKAGYIANIGAVDAYVWATIAVPAALYEYVDLNMNGQYAYFGWKDLGIDREMDVNGEKYVAKTILCEEIIVSDDYDYLPFEAVTLDPRVDYNNEDGKYYIVENGQATEIALDLSKFAISCSAYAIQSAGFENVDKAYAAYMEQWGDDHFSEGAVFVTTQDAFEAAAAEDGVEVILGNGEFDLPATISDGAIIRGNGNTVLDTSAVANTIVVNDIVIDNVIIDNEVAEALPISGTATIVNCDIACERGPVLYNCYADGEIIFENCNISSATYALNIVGSGNVSIYNSEIAGWCSFGGDVDVRIEYSAFNKCELIPENSVLRFYADAEIYNTVFAPEMIIDASEANSDVTIKLSGCSVSDGSDINAITNTANANGKTITYIVE